MDFSKSIFSAEFCSVSFFAYSFLKKICRFWVKIMFLMKFVLFGEVHLFKRKLSVWWRKSYFKEIGIFLVKFVFTKAIISNFWITVFKTLKQRVHCETGRENKVNKVTAHRFCIVFSNYFNNFSKNYPFFVFSLIRWSSTLKKLM